MQPVVALGLIRIQFLWIIAVSGQESFQERLERLAAEKGAAEPQEKSRRVTRAEAGLPSMSENIRYPLLFVWAAIVGMIAVFLSRYIRFHLTGGSLSGGENADMVMMIDGAIAAGTGFALKNLLSIEDKSLQFAQTVGVVIMVLAMHNLVHLAPKAFSVVFSPEWTQDVLETTEPKSLLFAGVTYRLAGGDGRPDITFPSMSSEDSDLEDYQ